MILALLSFIPGVGPFLAFAGRNPWVKRALDIAAAVLLVAAIVIGFAVHERHVGEKRVKAADAAAVAASNARDAAAQAGALAQRAKDEAAKAAVNEELSHADDATPDSRPSPARRAFLCAVLRQQGGSGAALPAECGPDAPAGTAPHR